MLTLMVGCIALLFSRFLLSQVMFACILLATLNYQNGRLQWNPAAHPRNVPWVFWCITGIFWITLINFYPVLDSGYFLERLRVKLPFLVLPWAFAVLPPLGQRRNQWIILFWLIVLTIVALSVGVNYALNYQQITSQVLNGHPIPVPENHIRFSLGIVIGIFCGMYLLFTSDDKKVRFIALWASIFLFIMLHVLSVRSGLLCFYLTAITLSIFYGIRTRKWKFIFISIGITLALPWAAYHTIPSFKNKIGYMYWDWQQLQQGTGENYSDSRRMNSILAGISIGKEHPLGGVGAGNLKAVIRQLDEPQFKDVAADCIMPHNQFIHVFASSGILGLLLFCIGLFIPLFYISKISNWWMPAIWWIIVYSCLVEATLENAVGIAYLTLLGFWGFSEYWKQRNAPLTLDQSS